MSVATQHNSAEDPRLPKSLLAVNGGRIVGHVSCRGSVSVWQSLDAVDGVARPLSFSRSLSLSVSRSLGLSVSRSLGLSVSRSLGLWVARSLARSWWVARDMGGRIQHVKTGCWPRRWCRRRCMTLGHRCCRMGARGWLECWLRGVAGHSAWSSLTASPRHTCSTPRASEAGRPSPHARMS